MNAAALIAALCITSVVDVPKNNTTMAWAVPAECSPEAKSDDRIAAPIQAKPQAKRKVASRCDGSKSECRQSRAECGRETARWYFNKKEQRRKFHCVKT